MTAPQHHHSCNTSSRTHLSPPTGRLLLLLLVLLGGTTTAHFDDYVVTTSTNADECRFESTWATYDNDGPADAFGPWQIATTATLSSDGIQPEPLQNFSMPFWSRDCVRIYPSSDGFLSLAPVGMCPGFCASVQTGFYKFDPSLSPSGGGDFPMIGLYVFNLDPANKGSTRTDGIVRFRVSRDASIAVVEYQRVHPAANVPADAWDETLTAKVVLHRNGSIVMKYSSVFASIVVGPQPDDVYVPTVGLVWTKGTTVRAPTPVFRGGFPTVCAVRYDPVTSPCVQHATCDGCVVNESCTWCASVSRCVARTTANGECAPAAQYANGTCAASVVQLRAGGVQQFYNATVHAAGSAAPSVFPWLTADASVSAQSVAFDGTTGRVVVRLPFNTTYFGLARNRTLNAASARTTATLTVLQSGAIAFGDHMCSGVACDATPPYSILPWATTAVRLFPGFSSAYPPTRVTTARVPRRSVTASPANAAAAFCWPSLAAASQRVLDTPADQCAEAAIIEYTALVAVDLSVQREPRRNVTVAVLVDAAGSVAVLHRSFMLGAAAAGTASCSDAAASVATAYPPPRIGMQRASAADASSVFVPWPSVRRGGVTEFTLVPGCPDCTERGRCDTATGVCICAHNFTGPGCRECASGFYGPTCEPCERCDNGGVCRAGRNGDGMCACVAPHSGRHCDVECTAAEAVTCDLPCSAPGGFCRCGKCVCDDARGWGGAQCSVWSDPCRRLSLDGCTACVDYDPVRCSFCSGAHDFRCIATGDAFPPGANVTVCRSTTTDRTTRGRCAGYSYAATTASLNVILIVGLFFLAVAGILGVVLLCICRKRKKNPLLERPTVGIPEFRRPVREREILHIEVVLQERIPPGKPVLGLPLRQVPMRQLASDQARIARGDAPTFVHVPTELPAVLAQMDSDDGTGSSSSGGDGGPRPRRRRRRRRSRAYEVQ